MSRDRTRVGSIVRRVRKDGTERFGVKYWVRGESDPRWELQPPGTSKAKAKARLGHLSGAAERGEVAIRRGVHWEEYSERWLGEQGALVKSGSLKPSTYADYEGSLRNHLGPFFTGLQLDEMARGDVRQFISYKVEQGKLKPKSINNLLVPLGLILRQAGEDGCTVQNPELGIRRVKVPRTEMEWYEAEEADRLVRHTPKEWRALMGLAVYAGLRQGEILALRWEDVDWQSNRLIVRRTLQNHHKAKLSGGERFTEPKTAKGRRFVPIRPIFRDLLEQHRAYSGAELLFTGERGGPVDPKWFCFRVYDPAVKRAGLRRIRFHDLRHSFVTICAAAGVPLVKVADWVGHSDSRITEVYRHASADSEEFALDLLRQFEYSRTHSVAGVA